MTKVIYKYGVPLDDKSILTLAKNAHIIHSGLDPNGVACIWVEFNPEEKETQELVLFTIPTGQPFSKAGKSHLFSFVQGPFVWHVYYLREDKTPVLPARNVTPLLE